jgi:hypothetical protein
MASRGRRSDAALPCVDPDPFPAGTASMIDPRERGLADALSSTCSKGNGLLVEF